MTGRFARDRATWALYAAVALFAYLQTGLGPAMPFVRDRLHLSYTMASLHFSAFAGGAIVAGAVGDRIARRFGRSASLWGGLGGMAVGLSLVALGPSAVVTVVGALAAGSFGTVALTADQAALSDLHRSARAVAIAESNVAASLAAIVAPLAVGGLAGAGLPWQAALLLGLPALLLLRVAFRAAAIPSPVPPTLIRDRSTDRLPRPFWLVCGVMFLASGAEWCVAYWGADFLATVVGLREATAATAMGVFFAAMVLGRFAGARLARQRGVPDLLLAAIAVALAGFPLFWLAPSPVGSLAGLFVAGVGIANFYPLTIGLATGLAADTPDLATARIASAGAAAVLVAPLAVGAISDTIGMRWGIGVVPVLLIGALVAVTAVRRADRHVAG